MVRENTQKKYFSHIYIAPDPKNKISNALQMSKLHELMNLSIVKVGKYTVDTINTQWTVDNSLRPDSLAGPKALDPKYCRQPTLCLYDLCLEVLNLIQPIINMTKNL